MIIPKILVDCQWDQKEKNVGCPDAHKLLVWSYLIISQVAYDQWGLESSSIRRTVGFPSSVLAPLSLVSPWNWFSSGPLETSTTSLACCELIFPRFQCLVLFMLCSLFTWKRRRLRTMLPWFGIRAEGWHCFRHSRLNYEGARGTYCRWRQAASELLPVNKLIASHQSSPRNGALYCWRLPGFLPNFPNSTPVFSSMSVYNMYYMV